MGVFADLSFPRWAIKVFYKMRGEKMKKEFEKKKGYTGHPSYLFVSTLPSDQPKTGILGASNKE